jgi:eukaryotic-like serine/threonine-protein kinase
MDRDVSLDSGGLGMLGRTIAGRYRIDRVLGSGGMGVVYSATHLTLARAVAVKLLPPRMSADQGVARFFQEARAASSLNLANVVAVFDLGTDPEVGAFLVMEQLEGETLERTIHRFGCLNLRNCVRILAPILRALSVVHRKNIVHRDLKPGNVFLARHDDGTEVPKILDFGVARVCDPNQQNSSLTSAGQLLGTLRYMSPEQAVDPASVDGRSDLYSIGAILYAMLAGTAPFAEVSSELVSHAMQFQSPLPLESFRPDLPVEVCALVKRAMARNRNERFQSADEFCEALEQLAQRSDSDTMVSVPPNRVSANAALSMPSAATAPTVASTPWTEDTARPLPQKRSLPRWATTTAMVLGAAIIVGGTAFVVTRESDPSWEGPVMMTNARPLQNPIAPSGLPVVTTPAPSSTSTALTQPTVAPSAPPAGDYLPDFPFGLPRSARTPARSDQPLSLQLDQARFAVTRGDYSSAQQMLSQLITDAREPTRIEVEARILLSDIRAVQIQPFPNDDFSEQLTLYQKLSDNYRIASATSWPEINGCAATHAVLLDERMARAARMHHRFHPQMLQSDGGAGRLLESHLHALPTVRLLAAALTDPQSNPDPGCRSLAQTALQRLSGSPLEQ